METIGRYQIKGELGRGGMAVVYRALDPNIGREVALKLMPREFLADPEFYHRFTREVRAIGALESSAIVPVYDFGEDKGQPYFVMRLMTGGSLVDKLSQGSRPIEEVSQFLTRLAEALDEAHAKGIIHRDLKPGNILLDHKGAPYLADFGIVKLLKNDSTITSRGVIGTPAYMSPEHFEGQVSARSDIYALGVITFQLLTGKLPFQARTPSEWMKAHLMDAPLSLGQVNTQLPLALQPILERALAKKPEHRYQSAGEFARAVSEVVKGNQVGKSVSQRVSSMRFDTPISEDKFAPIPPKNMSITVSQPISTLPKNVATKTTSFFINTILPKIQPHTIILTVILITGIIVITFWEKVSNIFIMDTKFIFFTINLAKTLGGLAFQATVLGIVILVGIVIISIVKVRFDKLSASKSPKQTTPQPESFGNGQTIVESFKEDKSSNHNHTMFVAHADKKNVFENKNHLIKEVQEKDIQHITANLNREGGSRILLTGFGRFGGTSLVQGITRHLMENFKGRKKALVIRFDIRPYKQQENYQIFINENKGGHVKNLTDLTEISQLVRRNLDENERFNDERTFFVSNTIFDQYTQDIGSVAKIESITQLVYQLLQLIRLSDYNDEVIENALDVLFRMSTNTALQLILILDAVDSSTKIERLLDSVVSDERRYPWLSVIIVAHHEKFNLWSSDIKDLLKQREYKNYYIRRHWGENLDVMNILQQVMKFNISAFNHQQKQQFDEWLHHLTYKARGSITDVLRQLKESYWTKNEEEVLIDFEEEYRNHHERIIPNARVQKILAANWDKIVDKSLLNTPELSDQARMGVYCLMDWIQQQRIFDDASFAKAIESQPITVSDIESIRKQVLEKLLQVLQENYYLEYHSKEKTYRLIWGHKPPTRAWQIARTIYEYVRFNPKNTPHNEPNQPVNHSEPSSQMAKADESSPTTLVKQTISIPEPNKDSESINTPPLISYHVGLLCDAQIQDDRLVTIVTQIAFELVEAGFCLVLPGRSGVEAIVRQKLETYYPLHKQNTIYENKPVFTITTNKELKNCDYEVVQLVDNTEHRDEFLEAVDIVIVAQKTEFSDALAMKHTQKRLKRYNKMLIPIGAVGGLSRELWMGTNRNLDSYYQYLIERESFAEISLLSDEVLISDIAKATVNLVQQLCSKKGSTHAKSAR